MLKTHQPESEIMEIAGIGQVRLVRARRARRLVLTLTENGVRLAVPRGLSRGTTLDFVASRSGWIEKQRKREATRRRRVLGQLNPADPYAPQSAAWLRARLAALAVKHGYRYGRVTVRHQRTRWGSCSMSNNISLNATLVRLPEVMRDYVMLHELVHTRLKHHGPDFWQALDALVGDARGLARQMREFGVLL